MIRPARPARPARRARPARPRSGRVLRLVPPRLLGLVLCPDGRAVGSRGQSTVEYALVLLGAAAVALALVAWVVRSDAVGRLFDSVVGRILQQAG